MLDEKNNTWVSYRSSGAVTIWEPLCWLTILIGLYVTSRYSYLLFHSLAEGFSIVVACAIFLITWNSRPFLKNDYILFLGIAFLFVAGLDFLHALAYEGMGVFAGNSANTATQLWIAARYLESVSFLVAPLALTMRTGLFAIWAAFLAAAGLLIGSIFYWKIFPQCYVEGVGLTEFKRISEYVICFILTGGLALLLKYRNRFDEYVLRLVALAIIFTILTELTFTRYVSVYGHFNLVGHYFKIISFFLMYVAVVETGFRRPYSLMLRELELERQALRTVNEELEERVAERTSQLRRTNEQLSKDIVDRRKAEFALLKSERLLKTILSASPVGIALTKARRIEWVNESWKCMLGFDDERECLGLDTRILCPSDQDYKRAEEALYRNSEAEEVSEIDIKLRRKDGSIFDANVKLKALNHLDFSQGAISVISDISFRKRAELEMEKLALIVKNASELIGLSDLNQRLIFLNEAGSRILGIPQDKVGNYCIQDSIAESYRDFVHTTTLPKLLQTGSWEGGLLFTNHETGHLIHMHCITFLIRDPATQEPLYMANVALDVTDQKKAEEKLRESEQRYRSLFEHSVDGVCLTTRDGVFVESNQSLRDICGFSREEMAALNAAHLYAEADGRARFLKEMDRHGHVRDYGLKMRRKDGKEIDCLLSASVWRDESGQILGYQKLLRDVTSSKMLEEQLRQSQKMESLGAMAGGIAHDFNNLLTIILGFSELLVASKTEKDPDYQDLLRIISSAEKGADLVRRILTFTRKVDSNPRPIDLNHEVLQSEKLLRRTVPKMIEIELRLADNLKLVNADPGQIEQVILNLAINARHAMPGGGTLTFKTENVKLDEEYCGTHLKAEPCEHVVLSVTDTGHGMDKEVMEHIFEPFFTTKEAGEGTGLGLAMVYGIVTSHGGRIQCDSEPGHGATFKIFLPAIEHEAESIDAARDELVEGGVETIILVDDEEFIRDLGMRILSRAGYNVITADTGLKALEIYRSQSQNISLVILDLVMPHMGGKECLKELLKIDPTVRALIASGFSANGPVKDAVDAGARGFVQKPYKATQLLQVVRKIIDEKR